MSPTRKKNALSRWMIYPVLFLFGLFFALSFRFFEIKEIVRLERLCVLLELIFGELDFFEIEDFRFRLIIVRSFKIEFRIDKLLFVIWICWIEVQIFRIKFDQLKKLIIVGIRCGNVIFDFLKIDSNESIRQIIRQFVSKKWWFKLTDWIQFRKKCEKSKKISSRNTNLLNHFDFFEILNHSYSRYFLKRFWCRLNKFFKCCQFENSRFDKMMSKNAWATNWLIQRFWFVAADLRKTFEIDWHLNELIF